MTTQGMRRTLLALPTLMALTVPGLAQVGSSGMPLLKLGVTGRAVAMGYTSALEDGPSAVQGNPAGIEPAGGDRATTLLFTHQEWVQDARTEFLGASTPLSENQTVAFTLLTTTVSDIEIRTVPGPAEGTFTSRDMALGISYAREFSSVVQAGVTARFLYQKILVNDATGFSFDAGARIALPLKGFEAGVAVLNLGRMSVLNQARTILPATARAGLGYHNDLNEDFSYGLRGDLVRVFPEKRFYEGVGGEFWFQKLVALRAGNEFGSEGRGFTAGLGVAYGMFALDYALAKLTENLGTTHTFTLGLTL